MESRLVRMVSGLSMLAVLLSAAEGQAAERFARAGVVEVGGVVSLSVTEVELPGLRADITQTEFHFSPEIGVFLAKGFELGFRPTFQVIDLEEQDALKLFGFFVNPSFNFDTNSRVFPFMGGDLGIVGRANGNSEAAVAVGGEAGIKIQLGTASLLRLQGQYIVRFFDNTTSSFVLGTGFTVFF